MQQYRGVYIISVAARLLEMHPQTLRKYERRKFVVPTRVGPLRLYSEKDIMQLRLIKHLVEEQGLNLAGVQLALGILNELLKLREMVETTEDCGELKQNAVEEIDKVLELVGAVPSRP